MEDDMLVLLITIYISLIIMLFVGICFGGYQAWNNDNKVIPDKEEGSVIIEIFLLCCFVFSINLIYYYYYLN